MLAVHARCDPVACAARVQADELLAREVGLDGGVPRRMCLTASTPEDSIPDNGRLVRRFPSLTTLDWTPWFAWQRAQHAVNER